ncbi:porin [Thiomicrorhabdus indica]|uniref:porin n=1 Tax=Thiomicrorhabdus indica TaxID=2267253 RepID=UPI002AA5FE89|nr:porin [Thiomicrorhabdus indica]
MKKNIIALAIASAIAAPVAMADAPTVYGQLNLNIANVDGNDTSVNSTASRIGVKGSEDLGDGLKAVYKIEFELPETADGDGKSPLKARNQYLGLAGGFGTVLMGRHDTPTKMIQPSDLFNDGFADLKNMTTLNGAEVRATDVLAYVSPSFGGVKLIGAAVMDEKAGTTNSGDTTGDWVNVAVTYGSTKEGLYLAAAWQDLTEDNLDAEFVRLSAQYKAGGLIANAMYQDNSGANVGGEGNFTQLQAGYKIGKFMPKVKYTMTDADNNANDADAYAVGLNYSLGKKTTAYVYYTDRDQGGNGDTATIAGLLHKF